MDNEGKHKWTGNMVTDCLLTWVEILEQRERRGKNSK